MYCPGHTGVKGNDKIKLKKKEKEKKKKEKKQREREREDSVILNIFALPVGPDDPLYLLCVMISTILVF